MVCLDNLSTSPSLAPDLPGQLALATDSAQDVWSTSLAAEGAQKAADSSKMHGLEILWVPQREFTQLGRVVSVVSWSA